MSHSTRDNGLIPVAVVGMGCVMPDAPDVESFWRNILDGHSSVKPVPKDRWDPELYFSADRSQPEKTYSAIGTFVDGFAPDWRKFKLLPKSLAQIDPSQFWALEATDQAFRDSGYDERPFDRSRCAVIFGNSGGGEIRVENSLRIYYPHARRALEGTPGFLALGPDEQERILQDFERAFKQGLPELTEDSLPGELSNVLAGRVANVFNLTGKNFTADAACASSLAAIEAGIHALAARQCDMVVTGASDRFQEPSLFVKFARIGALSATGSRPFDKGADGFVMGEGCGVLILKRLEDAQRDGDRIHAIIRGVGSSSDGKGRGITAPKVAGQVAAVERALQSAGLGPADIDVVECHGTGTVVGDAVEIMALREVFGPHLRDGRKLPIGSVKSNIGHLKSAAGVAGILKAILCLKKGMLAPTAGVREPNPILAEAGTPFELVMDSRAWVRTRQGPRRIGVSSFGFGGTNFHIILEEHGTAEQNAEVAVAGRDHEGPLVLEAPDAKSLAQLAMQASAAFEADAARAWPTWSKGVSIGDGHRAALAATRQTAAALLAMVPGAIEDPGRRVLAATRGLHFGQGKPQGRVAFMFPGLGSQHPGMLEGLAAANPAVRGLLERAYAHVGREAAATLRALLEGSPPSALLQDPTWAHVVVLLADLCHFEALRSHGLGADVYAGHSLGEHAALVAARSLTLEDALDALMVRGRAISEITRARPGAMAAVSADSATVEAALADQEGVVVASRNCPSQTSIAGAAPQLTSSLSVLASRGLMASILATGAAYHCPEMEPAVTVVRNSYRLVDFQKPDVPIISSVDATFYSGQAMGHEAQERLAGQLVRPVRWQECIEELWRSGVRTFIEVGPGQQLAAFARSTLGARPHLAASAASVRREPLWGHLNLRAQWAARGLAVQGCVQRPAVAL